MPQVQPTRGARSTWRVLVVDDDRTVAGVLCRLVDQLPGFHVVGASPNARHARQMITNLRPDLMLLDIGLPDESGTTLLRAIRSSSFDVEVIAVTADASHEAVRAFLRLGAVDYLVKPFRPERLTRALARFEHQARALRVNRLTQAEVDDIRSSAGSLLPRDISEERLDDIRAVLQDAAGPMTAQEIADRAFVARVTARRYLELLVTLGEATVTTVVSGPGRPSKAYEVRDIAIY